MKEVLEYLKKNKNIKTLLNEFKKDFNDTYYDLKDEQKKAMIDYTDTIIRKWLFSPLAEGTYVTPVYIINNIAQNKYRGDYWIIPSVKIKVNKDGDIKYRTKLLYYSDNENPVLEDLEKVLRLLTPTIIIKDKNKNLIDNGDKFIEKLTFRSEYYFEYLIDIAEAVGLIKSMKSIGCRCYIKGNNYEKYFNLSNERKINIIIEKSIVVATEKIGEIIEVSDKNSAIEFLNNSITEDTYFASMQETLEWAIDFAKNISNDSDYEEEIADRIVTRSMLGDDIGYWLVKREAGVYLDMNITCVFGYYLGIINPIYEEMFIPSLFMELMIYSKDPIEKMTFIFTMEIAHDLSKVGEKIMRNFNVAINDRLFGTIITCHIKECIKEYINKKDTILKELDRVNESFIKKIISGNEKSM